MQVHGHHRTLQHWHVLYWFVTKWLQCMNAPLWIMRQNRLNLGKRKVIWRTEVSLRYVLFLNSIHFAWDLFRDRQDAKWTGASLLCICMIIVECAACMLLLCVCWISVYEASSQMMLFVGWAWRSPWQMEHAELMHSYSKLQFTWAYATELVWVCICQVLPVVSALCKKEACRVFPSFFSRTLV